jgi:hypothetical protein
MAMNVFRLHVRPGGASITLQEVFQHCVNNHVLGVGWPVDHPPHDWNSYLRRSRKKYKTVATVSYLHDKVSRGDLIWTRDPHGNYFLARVRSEWEYDPTRKAKHADIVNIVRCEIRGVQIDEVPGKIVACFRARRTVQRISDPTSTAYSQILWNSLSTKNKVRLTKSEDQRDIFSCLDDLTTEDIVLIYLQNKGWLLIPQSRQKDTKGHEFVLIHRRTKKRALVQVKTGNSHINRDWSKSQEDVFLFQPNSSFDGCLSRNTKIISPKSIRTFMTRQPDLLPRHVKRWLDFVNE